MHLYIQIHEYVSLDEHKELYIEIHEYVSLDEHKEVHERIKVFGHLPSNLLHTFPYGDFARRVHFQLQRLNMLGTSFPVSQTVSTWKCNPILANRIEQKCGRALGKFSFPARREYMRRIRFLWMWQVIRGVQIRNRHLSTMK